MCQQGVDRKQVPREERREGEGRKKRKREENETDCSNRVEHASRQRKLRGQKRKEYVYHPLVLTCCPLPLLSSFSPHFSSPFFDCSSPCVILFLFLLFLFDLSSEKAKHAMVEESTKVTTDQTIVCSIFFVFLFFLFFFPTVSFLFQCVMYLTLTISTCKLKSTQRTVVVDESVVFVVPPTLRSGAVVPQAARSMYLFLLSISFSILLFSFFWLFHSILSISLLVQFV